MMGVLFSALTPVIPWAWGSPELVLFGGFWGPWGQPHISHRWGFSRPSPQCRALGFLGVGDSLGAIPFKITLDHLSPSSRVA